MKDYTLEQIRKAFEEYRSQEWDWARDSYGDWDVFLRALDLEEYEAYSKQQAELQRIRAQKLRDAVWRSHVVIPLNIDAGEYSKFELGSRVEFNGPMIGFGSFARICKVSPESLELEAFSRNSEPLPFDEYPPLEALRFKSPLADYYAKELGIGATNKDKQ
jgi:hypothetical protein